jgi:Ca2+-binding EF-hand superfamily protein
VDEDGNGDIDFEEFKGMMKEMLKTNKDKVSSDSSQEITLGDEQEENE